MRASEDTDTMRAPMAVASLLWLILQSVNPVNAASTFTGRVLDSDGRPVPGARVAIYTARPRVGASPLCPSCYPECGKHATTNRSGAFEVHGLNDSLVYDVLTLARTFSPLHTAAVDPMAGPVDITLSRSPNLAGKPAVRGRVVDSAGRGIAGAIVEPLGYRAGNVSRYGPIRGVDTQAITDDSGAFALATPDPTWQWFLRVTARDKAPRVFDGIAPERRRTRLKLDDGAIVTGRVLRDGVALPGIAVGIVQTDRNARSFLGPRSIGTDSSGRFTFLNIAPGHRYSLYGTMASLSAHGAIAAETVAVAQDADVVDVGAVVVGEGRCIAGRVSLDDGTPLPPGTVVMVSRIAAWDWQVSNVDDDGAFSFCGLPGEAVRLSAGVKGYRVSNKTRGFSPSDHFGVVLKDLRGGERVELVLERIAPVSKEVIGRSE
jgi:protocatechuate 3,4-dioxygenase beta subunit